jgi:hypothetical protein
MGEELLFSACCGTERPAHGFRVIEPAIKTLLVMKTVIFSLVFLGF